VSWKPGGYSLPELNGVGYGPESEQKQADFTGILRQHANISKGVIANPRSGAVGYTYLDLNAGPGYVPAYDIPGSPLIALDILPSIIDCPNFHFCEEQPVNVDQLCDSLRNDVRWLQSIHAYPGDNNWTVEPILNPLYSLKPYPRASVPAPLSLDRNDGPSMLDS